MNSDVKPENIRVRVDGVFINGNRDEGIKINGEIKNIGGYTTRILSAKFDIKL